MCVAKTKTLISCAVTAQLICAFVFACTNCWFYDAVAHYYVALLYLNGAITQQEHTRSYPTLNLEFKVTL